MAQHILPIELWLVIFELATTCPEEWEFGGIERSMTFWGRSPNTMDRWEDVLKTRRSLVAISRFFNQLSTPLLYQSFFAITPGQVSRFRRTLQTRPALGGYVKRLGLSPQLKPNVNAYYPHILESCPNVHFCDTELRLSDARQPSSLHSLELYVTPEFRDESSDPEFLHLVARILQATPQLEHLGVYWLPYRIKLINTQPLAAIRLGSLRSLHLRVCAPWQPCLDGIVPTILSFFSLNLPLLEHLLLEDTDMVGEVLNRIPASWLRQIRQFSVTYDFIARCSLGPDHFALLRKFTLDLSCVADYFWGQQPHQTLPFTQLEHVELFHCATPISIEYHPGYDALQSILSSCADATATPNLRFLTMDITELKERRRLWFFFSTKNDWKRLDELQAVVALVHDRGIDPNGLNSSALLPALQTLVRDARTWVLEP